MQALTRTSFSSLILGLLAVTMLSLATQASASTLSRVERALLRGEPNQALELINELEPRLHSVEARADAEGLRCQAFIKLSQPDSAIEACERALSLDNGLDSWRYWNNLGAAQLQLGEYDRAERSFRRAMTVSGWRRSQEPRQNLRMVRRLRANAESVAVGEH